MTHRTSRLLRLALPVGGALLLVACAEEAPPPKAPALPPPPPVASVAAAPAPREAPKADPSLLPRDLFFSNPSRSAPRLSPDGKRIAFLAEVGGVMNLHEAPADAPEKARAVTQETKRNIAIFDWAETGTHLLYLQDQGGDENFHVFAVDLKTSTTKDLTPFPGARAELVRRTPKRPGEVLVAVNDRDPARMDAYVVNITTGQRKLAYKNEAGVGSFIADDELRVRFAQKTAPGGGGEIVELTEKAEVRSFATVSTEDALTTYPDHLDGEGKVLFMVDSRERDTGALVAIDLKNRKRTVLFDDARSDVLGVQYHPKTHAVQAVTFERAEPLYKFADKQVEADYAVLQKLGEGRIDVESASRDDKRWVVSQSPTDGPTRYYRYDRDTQKASLLFVDRPALLEKKLAKRRPLLIKSRDGLELVSYLSLPVDSDAGSNRAPKAPLPLVLKVHGGPWARDHYGYDANHAWLASRGYAVLSVNYRGSTGFGKKVVNAGDRQWAGKMHDDLIDAVAWAVREGIADKEHIAIMGGSYGGYATLVGLTFTPDTFACGVDVVGPSNLETLLGSVPPYWKPFLEAMYLRVGDPRTEEGKKQLRDRSPLFRAEAIKRPLLIGQGANDPRVKQAEADQIVKAMTSRRIPVTYVLYPDEGHGFVRPENKKSFNAITEAFLAQCLGGPYQPVGDDFKGASLTVPVGAEHVTGLAEALPKR